MQQKIILGMSLVILSVLPMTATADYINTTGPTGHYYQYAVFTRNGSEFKGGYDVDSYEDLIYVNRDGTNLDVYQVTLLDSDGDGVAEPDQHPNNIGPDEVAGTADDQIGPIEERKLTYLKTYSIPTLSSPSRGELYATADSIYFLGKDRGDVYQYVFATGVTSKVVDSPDFDLALLGKDDVNGVWYAATDWGTAPKDRTVYKWNGTAWVECFTYANLAGGHMDGLEVIPDSNGTPYVYVSDMTSDYIGQWRYDTDTGSWKEENLFTYTDSTGSAVEGMGFGALEHIWVTGGNLYELGGGKISTYLNGNFSVDDGGECIPANSTQISYTASYENTDNIDIEDVLVSHTGGTWGGTLLNWNMGNIASGETDSVTLTVPLSPPLVPDTTFSNQFTLTSTTPGVPEKTVTAETLVCPNTPPVAQCKDVTLNLDSNGQVVLSPSQVDDGSYDPDSDPITYSLSKTNFSCSDIGTQHAVTLTVTDDGGLSDSCIANITVVDNLAPVPNAASLPQVTGQCSATIPVAPTATDNCAGTVTGTTGDPISYSAQGTNTVTWTFDDGKGNTATQTQQVVVQDTIAPTVITKNITVQLDSEGNGSIPVDAVDNGSTDNCCLGSKSISKSSFTCADVGQNTVTLTVTDCNGNSSSATAIVTVVDNIAPVVLTQDVVVYLDDCNASITADDINAGSHDACGIASLSLDQDSFTCSDIGDNTVTLTVTDNNGNSSSATATVTIPNRPPNVDNAYPSTDCFSMPPDHRMEEISIDGVTDPDGQPVTLEITSITSDEPILSGGCAEASIGENGTAELRVERYGRNGRVYMVNFTASDGQAQSDGSVKIVVPYGPLPRYTCEGVVDDGQNYDAADEASCPIVRPRTRLRQ
ncbi:MAG: hypothetical protein D3921_11985 [Candidatus Electrothrix sp. AW1]|nr:hypothetical protein [Candidatus Electrothrix gigas]